MINEEKVILVDKHDGQIGVGEKLRTHLEGRLHRAFSIFIFNAKGELLLHKRSKTKYHSAGLWTNTCCSHPRPGESVKEAAHRRLKEEMGFDSELVQGFSFIYKAKLNNNLVEHEFDHVLIGKFDGRINPNPEEVESWKWVGIDELKIDIQNNPEKYTFWLRAALDKVMLYLGFL